MKKIAIVSISNVIHMSLISLYTNYLRENNISYDIIYIDKYGINESIESNNLFCYKIAIDKNMNIVTKAKKYFGFRKFFKNVIKKNKYEFLVVWNELTAVLLSDILIRKFKNNYSVNVRDYHFNNNLIINNRLKKAIDSSSFTTISSDKFRTFLPKNRDYLMIHSMNMEVISNLSSIPSKEDNKITLLFIGNISFPKYLIELIDSMKNDSRYILKFVGSGTNRYINSYISNKNISNVVTIDMFPVEETAKHLYGADVIISLYDVGTKLVDTLLPIRLYYAVYLRIPIIVFENTYLAEVSNKLGIGYAISKNDFNFLGDNFYNWYISRDVQFINKKCEDFIVEIKNGHQKLRDTIDNCIINKVGGDDIV